jgi:hypothetical protein
MSRLGKAALVAGSAAVLTVGLVGSASAGVLTPLPESATDFQKAVRPFFDYDSDSCFPAAAIDPWGNLNGGLDDSGPVTGQCRSGHLGKANTYARSKCNNGWCGIVYTLYFEKDMSCDNCTATSHRHDWESVVVWVKEGTRQPSYVSASSHGDFSIHPVNEVPMDGAHVKIVYHKDGALTHAFRFAKWGETAEAWGDGGWDVAALLSWDHFPGSNGPALQSKLNYSSWGDANFPIQDWRFNNTLTGAKPPGIPFDPNA